MFSKGYRILKAQNGFDLFSRSINRQAQLFPLSTYSTITQHNLKDNEDQENITKLFKKYEHNIIYSGYIESRRMKLGYRKNMAALMKMTQKENERTLKMQRVQPLPLSLKFVHENNEKVPKEDNQEVNNEEEARVIQFPFKNDDKIELMESRFEGKDKEETLNPANTARNEVISRVNILNTNANTNWMVNYENFEDDDEINVSNDWTINYGTQDPESTISNKPCGGCGALLHCKDTSIPGYIPSEIFKNTSRFGGVNLSNIICQRCYFLQNYNLALQVRVPSTDYPKILKTIQSHVQALVILMVDLLDFPCSIWPGAAELLGRGRPIFVVGNKIDLLPQDGKGFLKRVEDNLRTNLKLNGFPATDIKQISLISATTGFGVEDLITKLQKFWEYRGDVFLIGCTNVGKSSLFNALLQSDYCKTQAVDLIQRATISQWPGTTLNLLKFPINRPSGYKLQMRFKRLQIEQRIATDEKALRRSQLKATKNPKYASLIGHIGQTFVSKEPVDESKDFFSINPKGSLAKVPIGINENDKIYSMSKWCYDTPGVIQSEQILHLLTAEELLLTLPKQLLQPKTFIIKPGYSIFVGGLGRLDFLKGTESTRFTVFCSSTLPITICDLENADRIYEEFLATNFFSVPINDRERLKQWPGLTETKTFTVDGVDKNISCADIVLSSTGWISITPRVGKQVTVQAWVPQNCGVHLRDPLLPNAVALRGHRIRDSVAYRTDKLYIE